jgi:hypothetical protein
LLRKVEFSLEAKRDEIFDEKTTMPDERVKQIALILRRQKKSA